MTRIMYDFTHSNVGFMKVNFPDAPMIAWYGTGSPGIEWTPDDRADWPHANMVEIDQGGAGTPILTAHIRDVENGAWTPGAAVDKTGWNVPRPTIYGSRFAIDQVVSDGWRGDVWLAAPGPKPISPPSIPGVKVVAVQWNWAPNYDESIVFDDTWYPASVPSPAPGGLSVDVQQRRGSITLSRVVSADHYVIHYIDSSGEPPIVLERVPQWAGTATMVLLDRPIPGSHGGTVYADAIVHSGAVRVGTVTLP